MDTKTFGIVYKNGKIEKQEGKSITEAYKKTGNVLPDGNINFSILDFFFLVPVPMTQKTVEDEFQLLIKKNELDDWEEVEKSTNFRVLDNLLSLKIELEGIFDGMIVNLKTENPVVWWKWEKKYYV